MYSVCFIKKTERSGSILRNSAVGNSIFCGSLFNPGSAIEAINLILIETSTHGVSCAGSPLRGSGFRVCLRIESFLNIVPWLASSILSLSLQAKVEGELGLLCQAINCHWTEMILQSSKLRFTWLDNHHSWYLYSYQNWDFIYISQLWGKLWYILISQIAGFLCLKPWEKGCRYGREGFST